MITQIRKTYKFRLYDNDDNKHLHQSIDVAGLVWNHSLALSKRYYRLYGKSLRFGRLKSHLAKLRKHSKRFGHYNLISAQSVQDVVERLEKAYKRFFTKQGGFPKFKKVKLYKSFTMKQNSWKLLEGNRVKIGNRVYKYIKTRDINGEIKTVTIKRDSVGHLWVCFSVIEDVEIPESTTSKIGGFDFGIKTFLTNDEGQTLESPKFFKHHSDQIAKLNRSLSRKQKGSRNYSKAKRQLAREHQRIADKRRDYFFKLAHQLCNEYDILCFEDLNLKGMQMMWGRIVSDYSFTSFVKILKHVAKQRGKIVVEIDRWYPSSKTCSCCGVVKADLVLSDRVFECDSCGTVLDRDHNAALNIKRVGSSTLSEMV